MKYNGLWMAGTCCKYLLFSIIYHTDTCGACVNNLCCRMRYLMDVKTKPRHCLKRDGYEYTTSLSIYSYTMTFIDYLYSFGDFAIVAIVAIVAIE